MYVHLTRATLLWTPTNPNGFFQIYIFLTYCNQRSSIVSKIYRESSKTLSTLAHKKNWWTLSASLYLQKDLKQFLFHTAKLEWDFFLKMPRWRPVLHGRLFVHRKNQWVGVWYRLPCGSQKIRELVKEPSTRNHWLFWVHNLPQILWNFSKAWNQQLLYY